METLTLDKKIKMLPDDLKLKVEGYIDALLEENGTGKSQILADPQGEYNVRKPVFGSGKGMFGKMAEDFDAPLDDFKEYM
ncbi:hypothetical protein GCM10023149_41070 [Mucilaginibacter gynuensis]|uniref:DUF2281 domain-containing protein n=1 Tax=Mucilaginibacter gynuensis TaxID=1302236 RepID=A0ABP8H3P9_9SPHI